MNNLLQLIIFTLFMSTATFANEFNDAINAVFGDATNYFTFEGTLSSNSSENKTITLSKVTRNAEMYGNRETFPLVILGSKTVTNGDTTTIYNITLSNTGYQSDHLFNFNDINYPVVLKLDGITAPKECKLMFINCRGLTELDLSNFDTSRVTNMHSMFYYCTNLAKINLSNLNTGNVTSMFRMFSECKALTELNLTSFDTSKVTSMGKMFENSKGLKLLRVKSDFPANPASNMDLIFRQVRNLMILSHDGTFDPGFESFVRENYSGNVRLFLEIEADKTLTCNQDTYTLFNNKAGVLFGNNSVLKNVVSIDPTDTDKMFYFVLADGATSATIRNIFAVQHDEEFDEDGTVYRIKHGTITGNYACITEDGTATDNISLVNDKFHLEDLARLSVNDTVSFAIHEGEFFDQNTVVIRNESDDPAKIAVKLSNDVNKEGYTPANVKLQGNSIRFFGDNSGFVNGSVIASGAKVEFAGNKSMFQTSFELTDNSEVEISESIDHNKDITVHRGSKLVIKKRSTLSGGILELK